MAKWKDDWNSLRRIIEMEEFVPSKACANRINQTVNLALKSLADNFYALNKDRMSMDWLLKTLEVYYIKPVGKRRDHILKNAMPKIHEKGLLSDFKTRLNHETGDTVSHTKSGSTKTYSANELKNLYQSVSGQKKEKILSSLEKWFPDDEDFETNFKAFLGQFGISKKKYKRSTWLGKIAEHLSHLHRL